MKYIIHLFAFIGSILIIAGAFAPWVTFLGGLQSIPGIAGLNGKILFGIGSFSFLLTSIYFFRREIISQIVLGTLGAISVAYTGYLLFTLFKTLGSLTTNSMSAMTAAGYGPGLFIALIGSVLLFIIFFLPESSVRQK